MKYIITFILALISMVSFALGREFLKPDEAFKTKFIPTKDGIIFDMKLGKDIYLYHDKLQVNILKPIHENITHGITLPQKETFKDSLIISKDFSIKIPLELLQSKMDASGYLLQVKYQGCLKFLICYPPMSQEVLYLKQQRSQ